MAVLSPVLHPTGAPPTPAPPHLHLRPRLRPSISTQSAPSMPRSRSARFAPASPSSVSVGACTHDCRMQCTVRVVVHCLGITITQPVPSPHPVFHVCAACFAGLVASTLWAIHRVERCVRPYMRVCVYCAFHDVCVPSGGVSRSRPYHPTHTAYARSARPCPLSVSPRSRPAGWLPPPPPRPGRSWLRGG